MKKPNQYLLLVLLILGIGCDSKQDSRDLSEIDKSEIKKTIQQEIDKGIEATRTKDIELYMTQIPNDMLTYSNSGEVITREMQKEYTLRDWAIIDTTLNIMMRIDSMQFMTRDSVIVYTYQEWERMMFQRDGVTTDTILTNQRHKESLKKTSDGWFGYEVKELGGQIFINGKEYNPG